MNTMGLDLSLTGTGIVVLSRPDASKKGVLFTKEVKTSPKQPQLERYEEILKNILDAATIYGPEWIFIENYAYARANRMAMMGELGGIVKYELWKQNYNFLVVAPKTLKKEATGNGNASKQDMIDACPLGTRSHNISDAWHLANHAQHEFS